MIKTKFPQLEPIPKTLGESEFLTPLLAISQQRIADNATRALVPANGYMRLLSNPEAFLGPSRQGPAFLVRLYLAKVHVTVARCFTQGEHHAMRLADLTRLYFWRYRVRSELVETDFNFPLAQAQDDLKNETLIVNTLKALDSRLADLKLVPSAAEADAAKKSRSEKLSRGRPSINADIKRIEARMDAGFRQITDCLNEIKKGLFKC